MKFVKSILKVLPEIMVLLSSMSYIIIRLVADMNKVSLPTWFDSFNIPMIALGGLEIAGTLEIEVMNRMS